ncbi:hypothetical protein CCB80_11480 [Armatimonadetes bacterium Uphvl-Ar1]|nr:hypothetical protein CCB80_11480 [Armatimonadetes bacterium Uphvl-Ar1]
MSQYQRVGDWMVENKVISEQQRDEALRLQKESKQRFGEVLISLGYITERQVVECLSRQYDLPICELSEVKPSETALRLVSPTFALSRLILPLKVTATEFHCAICDPLDIEGTDYLTKALGKRLHISIAGPGEIFDAIAQNYAMPTAKKSAPLTVESAAPEKPKTKAAPTKKSRPTKVHEQTDRRELLAAIAGTGSESIWDTFQD